MNAKRLSKRVIASLLAMMLVIGCFLLPATLAHAEGSITVKFHYLRDDGNYDNMAVWAWPHKPTDGGGAFFDFVDEGDPKGAVAVYAIPDGTTEIGFIVTSKDWAKDPDGDRFLDIGGVMSGTINVYCKTGETAFDVVNGDDVVIGIRLTKAAVEDIAAKNVVSFELTGAPESISASDFSVKNGLGEEIAITSFESEGNKGKITLADNLDMLKSYTLSYGTGTIAITLPDYYSSEEFESLYTYTGTDLGATWSADSTFFRVWAPTANGITLNLYEAGDGGEAYKTVEMTADVNGTWKTTVEGNLDKVYYTYTAHFDGSDTPDIVDPYAKSVGVNGNRGQILNLDATDPEGWDSDTRKTTENINDLVIYELHIRDFSIDEDSGMTNKGKYLAFTETGTKTSSGQITGIDYLKDLGVTTVHILPSYDFATIDETKLQKNRYNWGYDPKNYNAPEGSYSTDPYHGEVRINEYKQMVKALHDAGIGVVMDVVYNHTYAADYCYNLLVPGYFHRPNSNGSGCGNDVASERSMVNKFITESVAYWAEEYHLDGFRFDLMGLIDVDTMNNVRKACDKVADNIVIYGEGWSISTNITKNIALATQPNSELTPGIAYFSDTIRDGIKGSVFEATDKGFVNGNVRSSAKVLDGVKYSESWSASPTQAINYAACHDNLTLWDKINSSNPDDPEESRISQNKFAAAIVFTAQGTPFMLSGEEFLRTKVKSYKEDGTPVYDHNSYSSKDAVNALYYTRATQYADVYNYYKGLIQMRKAIPEFRLTTVEDVENKLAFVDGLERGIIAYSLGDKVFVIYNALAEAANVTLPAGKWNVVANGDKAGTETLATVEGTASVPTLSAMVLVAEDYKFAGASDTDDNTGKTDGDNTGKTDGDNTGKTDGDNTGKTDGDNTGKTDGNNTGKTDGGNTNNGNTNNGNTTNTNNNDGKGDSNVPYTGDPVNVALMFVLAVAAGAVVFFLSGKVSGKSKS